MHVPRCGWRVRAFDENDLVAYLEVREVLENKALALARPHLVEADLRRMLAGNVSRSGGPRLDNSLHRYLVEKSGNDYLREFFDRHGAYYTSLLDFAAPETCVVAAMARQHRKILRALIAQDWARAAPRAHAAYPRSAADCARAIAADRPKRAEQVRRRGADDRRTHAVIRKRPSFPFDFLAASLGQVRTCRKGAIAPLRYGRVCRTLLSRPAPAGTRRERRPGPILVAARMVSPAAGSVDQE